MTRYNYPENIPLIDFCIERKRNCVRCPVIQLVDRIDTISTTQVPLEDFFPYHLKKNSKPDDWIILKIDNSTETLIPKKCPVLQKIFTTYAGTLITMIEKIDVTLKPIVAM